jgi:hypothetical protein
MNAKQVLSKIINALSMEKEVAMAYAKLADGTILESPTFDVGEEVSVVSEDGTKTPAPNGEHEVILKDSEGNDVRIKVMTTDGKITERENVELAEGVKEDEVKKLPEDMASIAGEDIGEGEEESEDAEVEPITEDMASMVEKMQYRISELEKKYAEFMVKEDKIEGKPAEDKKEADIKMEEEELPKLDGAPIDENTSANASKEKQKFGKKVASAQNTFLSKLYK